MAPEQASGHGDKAGPAADIYSLGAILYECLARRPPFTGANALETIEQVRSHEPVAPRSLNPKVPRDLETICLKCLLKDPAKRYASAKLLADDLSAFLSGKPIKARPVGTLEKAIKWTKRRPAVAALVASLALVAIVGAVLVTWKWREAVANAEAQRIAREDTDRNAAAERVARMEADAQRGRAERQTRLATSRLTQLRDVSEKLLFDFDDEVARLPGSTPVRKKFVDTALAQFNALRREVGDDLNLLHFLAVAYCKVGDVQGNPNLPNLNDLFGALASYGLAREVADTALRIQPDDRVARRDRMIVFSKIGSIHEARGDTTEALAKYRESQRIADDLATPSNAQSRRDVAIGHERIGRALASLGKTKEAADSLDRALKEYQNLAAGNPEAKRDLAVAYQHVGETQTILGLMKDALASYRKHLELLEESAQSDPDDATGVRDRMVAHNKIGDTLARMGNALGAQEHFASAKELADRLGMADVSNAQAQRDRALSLERIGEAHALSGRTSDALKAFTESGRIRGALAEGDPENPLLQRELSVALEKVGDQLLATGKRADAEKAYKRSLELRKDLGARFPEDVENQRVLAVAFKKFGAFYLRTGGSPKLAREHILEALRIRRAMCQRDAQHVGNQNQLAMSLVDAGDAEKQLLRRDEAGAYYREAIAVARKASNNDPANNWARDTLAGALERYGKWLSDHRGLDDPFTFVGSSLAAVAWERYCADQAFAQFSESLAIWEKLAQDKSDLQSQRGLSVALEKLGFWLRDEGRFNDALSRFRQRHDLCLAIDKPRQDAGARRDLATSFEHLGSTQQHLAESIGELAGRLAALNRAIGPGPWSAAPRCVGVMATGQLDQALTNLSRSRTIRQNLLKNDPANPALMNELATTFEHAGHVFRTLRNRKQSLSCFDDACKLRDQAAAQQGWEDPTVHRVRALTYYWRADAHAFFAAVPRQSLEDRLTDFREAKQWYTRSRDVYLEMNKRNILPLDDRHMIDDLNGIIAECDSAITRLGGMLMKE